MTTLDNQINTFTDCEKALLHIEGIDGGPHPIEWSVDFERRLRSMRLYMALGPIPIAACRQRNQNMFLDYAKSRGMLEYVTIPGILRDVAMALDSAIGTQLVSKSLAENPSLSYRYLAVYEFLGPWKRESPPQLYGRRGHGYFPIAASVRLRTDADPRDYVDAVLSAIPGQPKSSQIELLNHS